MTSSPVTGARMLIVFALFILGGCASYRNQASDYYNYLQRGEYEKASASLDHTKILSKSRNKLLLLLEKGKLAHLRGHWEESNTFLNEADNIIEDGLNRSGNFIAGTLINPMMSQYQPESFERYLVHYYKALNYIQLGQNSEAVVEARRISLSTFALQDLQKNENKYSSDPFAYMFQGLIYENNGDANNAFIAYRNAVDLYLEKGGVFYGTPLPAQLRKDLFRAAAAAGFMDEVSRYENIFGSRYTPEPVNPNGELILFWENGAAPVKEQQDFFFSLLAGGDGLFYFRDNNNFYNIPLDRSIAGSSFNPADVRSFRMAIPRYRQSRSVFQNATVILPNGQVNMEMAENINALAVVSLDQRMGKELASALTRMAVKKIAEAAVRPKEDKKTDNANKTEEEKKKDEKKKNTAEAISLGLQLFNLASEKADTRNWQSLPASIYYARIPLVPGENKISLQVQGRVIEVNVSAKPGMQFQNISSFNN
ncbi:MAG: hypothetical protein IPP93_01805 [Chitinophagaceae bacterium]|nr:hypothetical protein [Chitinophagaceae bacterium]